MRERLRNAELAYALLTVAATAVLATLVLHLWNASLGVPFLPGGDGYLQLMQIKGELDTGWVLTNPHLGAPFGQQLYDYAANRELIHVLVVDALGLFTSNPAVVYNVYFLLSFPLIGLVAYLVLRWVGLSRPTAAAMAVLFAFAPFHFRHQTYLWAYWAVPLAAYLILSVYSGAPLFETRRRGLLTLAVAATVALTSFYFAGFTVILILFAAAITFVVSRRRSTLVTGAVIVVAIVAIGAIAESPGLVHRLQHGSNPVVAKRGEADSQTFSTNILQLVMPVGEHRVGPLRNLSARWLADSKIDGEATHLGLIAALGFVWLLAVALVAAAGAAGRFVRDPCQRHLALATLTALLVGTTGGVSGLIAYGISPQLRSWTRLSIFIGFFALAAIGLLIDAGAEALRRRGVRLPAAAVAALLVGLCAIGTLDQTTSLAVPRYEDNAAAWDSDASFAEAIEGRVGEGGSVYQLPYVQFPESEPLGGTGPYDHVRPYLHTGAVDWSYGSIKGRDRDWQADTSGAPPDQLVPAVAAAGFDGVYVDRAAYPDLGRELETQLEQTTGAIPMVSPDNRFSFFDLASYADRQRSELTPAQIEALGDATVHPVRTEWTSGFGDRGLEGLDSARWATTPNPRLTLVNPADTQRSTELFVRLTRKGGDPATVTIVYPDGMSQRVDVPAEGVDVERTLDLPPGSSTVRLEIDGGQLTAEGTGYLQLVGWRLTPALP
jgi:phosphoglycerol transferase